MCGDVWCRSLRVVILSGCLVFARSVLLFLSSLSSPRVWVRGRQVRYICRLLDRLTKSGSLAGFRAVLCLPCLAVSVAIAGLRY